jgi:hypothetical protein
LTTSCEIEKLLLDLNDAPLPQCEYLTWDACF